MSIFNETGALHPTRNPFDLSHERLFTAEAGKIIPCCLIDCVPGDKFVMSAQALVRLQPMAAPLMETLQMYAYYFFVPYRILQENWEDFITGGKEGTYEGECDVYEPTDYTKECAKNTLWDYFGFPTAKLYAGTADEIVQFRTLDDDSLPLAFPWKAYNKIYNEYFRDQNLQEEVDLMNNELLNRAWKKDYFTSALPWQQRGIAPSIPLTGTGNAVFNLPPIPDRTTNSWGIVLGAAQAGIGDVKLGKSGSDYLTYVDEPTEAEVKRVNDMFTNNNTVDMSTVGTFNVSDLRLITQIQKWMERNARGGVRYTEFLGQHFGVAPTDARLDRPEYIGGLKAPIILSEILQTSESDTTPQGNMTGKGLGATHEFIGDYFVEEFGLIMGVFNIMPRPKYQQGISRHWTKRTRYDYYFPEFQNLSEQAIHEREIFLQEDAEDNAQVFGFQGRYDEYRIMENSVHGDFRDTLDYWHMGRIFTEAPNLNEDFIKCEPTKRNFLVQDEPQYLVQYVNQIKATRPMPYMAEPGLLDHD